MRGRDRAGRGGGAPRRARREVNRVDAGLLEERPQQSAHALVVAAAPVRCAVDDYQVALDELRQQPVLEVEGDHQRVGVALEHVRRHHASQAVDAEHLRWGGRAVRARAAAAAGGEARADQVVVRSAVRGLSVVEDRARLAPAIRLVGALNGGTGARERGGRARGRAGCARGPPSRWSS